MTNEYIKGRYFSSMTPKEQVYALLERASSCITQAKTAFENSAFEEANRLLQNAQSIFVHLRSCIRGEDEKSRHTAALFDLLVDELFFVNLNRELDRLEEIRVLTHHLQITYGSQLGKLRFE